MNHMNPTSSMEFDVIIIGGGAAGMMAAGTAGKRGRACALVERNPRVGRKIMITGKGRCNITNDLEVPEFLNHVVSNPKFLYSALYTLDSAAVAAFFHELGVRTKVERGNRVFPLSDKASEVVDGLRRYVLDNKVRIVTGRVQEVRQDQGKFLVRLHTGLTMTASSVVIATGGKSYPKTGSTGDGYELARSFGHTVIPPTPGLVPLETKETWPAQCQGLSLKNIHITLHRDGSEIYQDFGEMLFTHFGVSGPVILSASSFYTQEQSGEWSISIDLKPALSLEKLDLRVQRDFHEFRRKQFQNALSKLLPRKLLPVIIELSGIDPGKQVSHLNKEERSNLTRLLKDLRVTVKGTRPLEEAIVTRGGIHVEEVDSRNMESKLIKGVYFCGEVLDVDALTGGFNLQIAFSTGYLAGLHCG